MEKLPAEACLFAAFVLLLPGSLCEVGSVHLLVKGAWGAKEPPTPAPPASRKAPSGGLGFPVMPPRGAKHQCITKGLQNLWGFGGHNTEVLRKGQNARGDFFSFWVQKDPGYFCILGFLFGR